MIRHATHQRCEKGNPIVRRVRKVTGLFLRQPGYRTAGELEKAPPRRRREVRPLITRTGNIYCYSFSLGPNFRVRY